VLEGVTDDDLVGVNEGVCVPLLLRVPEPVLEGVTLIEELLEGVTVIELVLEGVLDIERDLEGVPLTVPDCVRVVVAELVPVKEGVRVLL